MRIHAPYFEIDECRNEREKEFILALHSRAQAGRWNIDGFPSWDGRFTVSVSLMRGRSVCRSPRIDFDGDTLLLGDDETLQFATDLDPARTDVIRESNKPPAELARIAVDWLEREIANHAELHKSSLFHKIRTLLGFGRTPPPRPTPTDSGGGG
jgi:hypothetical protein